MLISGFLFWRVPSSFVPDEDQGFALGLVQMPVGSTMPRTREFMTKVSATVRKHEAVDSVFEVTGFSFLGAGESVGIFFIKLKDWGDRKATAAEFSQWAFMNTMMTERDGTACSS